MAWRKNDPNLTNNPAYLEPRVTKLSEELAENAKSTPYVSVTNFGAKLDYTNDDSQAYVDAVNYAVANKKKGLFIPSNVTKLLTAVDVKGLEIIGENTTVHGQFLNTGKVEGLVYPTDKTVELGGKPQFALLTLPPQNKKVLLKESASRFYVFSKNPTFKNKLLGMLFEKGIVSQSDASNYGGTSDLFRLTHVTEINEVKVNYLPETFITSASNFTKQTLSVPNYIPGTSTLISNNGANAVGNYFEFDIVVDKKQGRYLDLAFNSSSGSCADVTFTVDGVAALSNISLVSATSQVKVVSVDLNGKYGTLKIRVTGNVAGGIHFIGANFINLQDYSGEQVNGAFYKMGTNHYISHSSKGANDYALNEYSTKKWFGSFHGAETLDSIKYMADGATIDFSSMAINQAVLFESLEILQNTTMLNNIKTNSSTKIRHDGTFEFDGYFKATTPLELDSFYTTMTCSDNMFDKVIYPKVLDTPISASGTTFPLKNLGKVTQMKEETNQKITTYFNIHEKYNNKVSPLRVFAHTNYCKVYHAPILVDKVILDDMYFSTIKVFH